ncbi:MAG: TonB C-terminal domain-containing protein [Candidatus Aminicenantes bacterium]|nr:TonB C-terminal domain-containing protein [Candidatus Aminicenantes bacterium]
MKRAFAISILIHAIFFLALFRVKIDLGGLKKAPIRKPQGLYAYIPPFYYGKPGAPRPESKGKPEIRGRIKSSKGKISPPTSGIRGKKGKRAGGIPGLNGLGSLSKADKGLSLPGSGKGENRFSFIPPSEVGKFLSGSGFKYVPKGRGVVTGGAVFQSGSYDITPWAEKVIKRIRENWHPPLAVQLGLKGLTVLKIIVEPNGEASMLIVERHSGISAYDQAAYEAVKSSLPFPPLPSDYPYSNLVGHLYFYYNLR